MKVAYLSLSVWRAVSGDTQEINLPTIRIPKKERSRS